MKNEVSQFQTLWFLSSLFFPSHFLTKHNSGDLPEQTLLFLEFVHVSFFRVSREYGFLFFELIIGDLSKHSTSSRNHTCVQPCAKRFQGIRFRLTLGEKSTVYCIFVDVGLKYRGFTCSLLSTLISIVVNNSGFNRIVWRNFKCFFLRIV